MAAIAPTVIHEDVSYRIVEWSPLVNAAVGAPLDLHNFNDLTFKSYGTYGAGGEVTMLGGLNRPGETSDAGSALEEEAGTALVLNAASPWGTSRNAPMSVWPSVTGGDGTTSLTVRAVIRR